jgi:ankyrin repeat protein
LDVALYLLKRGADPSIANEYGETPFDVAQIARLSSMVVALTQAGAAICSNSTCEASPEHLDAAARWDEFRRIQEMNFLDRSLIVGVRQGH